MIWCSYIPERNSRDVSRWVVNSKDLSTALESSVGGSPTMLVALFHKDK